MRAILTIFALALLVGCSGSPEKLEAIMTRLEFGEGEEGCLRITGDIDLGTSPIPVFSTSATMTLVKQKGDGLSC